MGTQNGAKAKRHFVGCLDAELDAAASNCAKFHHLIGMDLTVALIL